MIDSETKKMVNNWYFYSRCAGWELKLALWPRRCNISGKRIWLTCGYKGTAWLRSGDILVDKEVKWHDKIEHIIWQLKR